MSIDSMIRNHVREVSYRFGKISAERKDAKDSAIVENSGNAQATQEFNVTFSWIAGAIIAEVGLILDSELFRIEVLVSGRWELAETAPDDRETRREFAQTFALPRLIAVVESEAASLARQIQVPLPVFTFEVDNDLLDRKIQRQAD